MVGTIPYMNLDSSIAQLPRVGAVVGARLQRLGIRTLRDLLWFFPVRYEDFRNIVPIVQLAEGAPVTIKARIETIAARRARRVRLFITEAIAADDTGRVRVVWFGQPYIAKSLVAGDVVFLSGTVTTERGGLQLKNPAYEKTEHETTHTARLVPHYNLTAGLTHKQVRYLVKQILTAVGSVPDWLPPGIKKTAGVSELDAALRGIHFPRTDAELSAAKERLKFDELFIVQLRAETVRQARAGMRAQVLPFEAGPVKAALARLPFTLTTDQKTAAWEIFQDLEKTTPMNRLLEGDVGSGKTAVAAMALYWAAYHGRQAAIMAPTEILARQHYETVSGILTALGVPVALLTGHQALLSYPAGKAQSEPPKSVAAARRAVRAAIASGEVPVTIGTQALLSENIEFSQLALVVVDEQHRFGVRQRQALRQANTDHVPHFLSLTATPIPRSYALALYGDLDVSIIKHLPPGRKPIKTRLVDITKRADAYKFIREQIKAGRQAFVICPLIEESNEAVPGSVEQKSVVAEAERLQQEVFPDLKIGLLHGKMPAKEKDKAMADFAANKTHILVATSVVEVGVNIPNASVMVIEGADRFGLAQLHQFRGRVGRSVHQSYCLLFTESKSVKSRERLQYFESTLDGFALAEYDLEQRGPGEVYGTAQSGELSLRLASLQDRDLIKKARELARGFDFAAYPEVAATVRGWEATVHLE